MSPWNFSVVTQTALTKKPVAKAAASTIVSNHTRPRNPGRYPVYPTLPGSSNTGAGANSNVVHFQPCVLPQSMQTSQQGLNTQVTKKDLAELLAISRKDPLPQWEMDTYDETN